MARVSDKKIETSKQYIVYILRCHDGSLYTGWTNNLEIRLVEHNAGKASKYTRSKLPVKLVFQEEVASKSEALKREIAIKKLQRQQKESLIKQKPKK